MPHPTPNAKPLHLALASDGNPGYIAGLTVAAASALRHLSPNASRIVHILDCGIPDADFAHIEAVLRKVRADVTVRRHPINPADFKDFPPWKGSLAVYARLILPELLPEADWVCYADCDILFTGDLAERFTYATEDALLLGHIDVLRDLPNPTEQCAWFAARPELPFDINRYICTGFILINLAACRAEDITRRSLEFLHTYPDVPFVDQDTLNSVCFGRIGLLPDAWGTLLFLLADCSVTTIPGAIHFAGVAPWVYSPKKHTGLANVYQRTAYHLYDCAADELLPKHSPFRAAMPRLRGLWWRRHFPPSLWLRLPRWMAAPPWVRDPRRRAKRLWKRRGEPLQYEHCHEEKGMP